MSPNDGHVICFGTNSIDGTFDPLLVRWSDQEDFSNWAVSSGTTSRENPLADGTEIVGAVRSRGQILIWTDNSLHNMVFTGERSSVFRFTQLGTKCGLIYLLMQQLTMMVYLIGWVTITFMLMMVEYKIYHVQ